MKYIILSFLFSTTFAHANSMYQPMLDRCYKADLENFNKDHYNNDRIWKQTVICYEDENYKLGSSKLKLESCVDAKASRGYWYDQAYCQQTAVKRAAGK